MGAANESHQRGFQLCSCETWRCGGEARAGPPRGQRMQTLGRQENKNIPHAPSVQSYQVAITN